jgi:CheY-like chemotaxis protein
MTANAMPSDERICLDAGMDAYVAKPLNLDSVLNNIAHLLPPRTA